jgi:hypothetical protein
MKAIISFLFLLTICFNGHSQIVDTNNSWNYLEVLIPTCDKSTNCEGKFYSNHNYKIGNDTIIHNKVYARVIETIINNNDIIIDYAIAGFLREEENHKKVYLLLSDLNDSTEVLLYDFTIKKDSVFNSSYEIHLAGGHQTYTSTFYNSHVLDIDSVVYQGIKRMRIKFIDFQHSWVGNTPVQDTLQWIEGIGSNKGLLNYPHGNFDLLCFKQNEELKFQNNLGIGCNYAGPVDKIENFELNEISFYPNPLIGETLTISSAGLIKKITIYTVSGNIVEQYFTHGSQVQIQLNSMKPGFYIISVDNQFSKLLIQ